MTNLDASAIEEVASLATAATEPSQLELGGYYVVVTGGQPHKIDLTGDEYQVQPRRKKGITTVRDVSSFAAYYAKHSQPERSEVYATRDTLKVTAVLDAHGGNAAQTDWAQHRLVLALEHTTAFKAWRDNSGKEMGQEEFATFLEDNRVDIQSPPAAEMLEVAQSIQATSSVEFASGHRLVDGQRRISYSETIASKAGTKGELAIPAEIVLGLFVFKGATVADAFTARFRHRINGGQLKLMYKLDRPDDVVDSAYEGVIADVAEACAATVLRGTPA